MTQDLDRKRATNRAYMREYAQQPGYRDRKAAYDREYRKANLDRRRRQDRAYAAQHSAERRAYKAAWYRAHSEELALRAARRYRQDPERMRRRVAAWQEEHPTRVSAASAARNANRKAESLRVFGHLSVDDVIALWQSQPTCVRCGEGRGLDHVHPMSKGGSNTTANIQNLCRSCNSSKRDRIPETVAA